VNTILIKRNLALICLVLLLVACGGGDDGISGTGFDISGAIQKGPFVIGSSINVNFLDSSGNPTTDSIPTVTSDDLGSFGFDLKESQLVNIEATGYHRNELTGKLSKGPLTLSSIYYADGTNNQTAYVNVLTHLIQPRVIALIASGIDATEAITTAQNDFVAAFQSVLPVETLPKFSQLNIYDTNLDLSHGNAYLLALSATVYQYATVKAIGSDNLDAELTALLNTMADTFKNEGHFEEALVNELAASSRLLRPDTIEENLKLLSFDVIKERLAVPNINRYIDTDGDGIVNLIDDDDDGDGIADSIDENPYIVNKIDAQLLSPVSDDASNAKLLKTIVTNETLVTKVEYLINGESVGESNSAPFTVEWNSYYWENDSGKVNLSTRISDIGGNVSFGPTMEVSLDNSSIFPFVLMPEQNTSIRDTNIAALSWTGLLDASKFKIQVWKTTEESLLIVDTTLVDNTYDVIDLSQGEYNWRIQAANEFDNWGEWSEPQTFVITGPIEPILVEPNQGSIFRDTNQAVLKWESTEFAESYTVELASDINFSTILYQYTTSSLEQQTEALSEGEYYWRVSASNSIMLSSQWSEVNNFVIDGPVAPTIISPLSDASVANDQDVTFEWNVMPSVTDYEFQVAQNTDFLNPDVSEKIDGTNIVTRLSTGKRYWRVRAINDYGFDGEWTVPQVVYAGLFSKYFGGEEAESASSVIQTSDGGYLLLGSTKSFGVQTTNIYIVKLSPSGEEVWSKTKLLDPFTGSSGKDIVELSDENIIVIGGTCNWPDCYDWVLKLDAEGETLWGKKNENQKIKSIVALDEGYVIGYDKLVTNEVIDDRTYPQYVPSIVQFDLEDTEVWNRTFDESIIKYEYLMSVELDKLGNLVVAGTYDPTPEDVTDTWENKVFFGMTIDSLGEIQSPGFFSVDDTADYYYVVNRELDDGFHLVATKLWAGVESASVYTLYDELGVLVWSRWSVLDRRGGGAGGSNIILSEENENLVIIEYGRRYINGSTVYGLHRLTYSRFGHLINSEMLASDGGSEKFYSVVISTTNDGYLMVGEDSQTEDILVTKMDSNGNTAQLEN